MIIYLRLTDSSNLYIVSFVKDVETILSHLQLLDIIKIVASVTPDKNKIEYIILFY